MCCSLFEFHRLYRGYERAESSTDCGFWMQLLGSQLRYIHTIRVTDYLPFVCFIDTSRRVSQDIRAHEFAKSPTVVVTLLRIVMTSVAH